MPVRSRSPNRAYPTLPSFSFPFCLLLALLGTIWLAGGASRADALGQVVVRGAAWISLLLAALFGKRPSFRHERPILFLLLATLALPLLQLVPLPPYLWEALPGRHLFGRASAIIGETPWRPWAIVPGTAANALSSLVVPSVIFVLVAGLTKEERLRLPGVLLGLIIASTLVGLLQFSGTAINNPFVNDTPGEVSGTFANRNHFALFVAIGCLLAPAWAFLDGRKPHWRGPAALGLVLLFALMILASGSRAGMLDGALALVAGLLLARHGLRREFGRAPRWAFPAVVVAVVAMVAMAVLVSIAAGRAASIDRVLAVDVADDMRSRGLPTVLTMIGEYFPVGSGLGSFDPMFRIHEPLTLLKFTYFNHAHNDFLEVVLDAGLPGLLLLTAALLWWGWTSVSVWRVGFGNWETLPKLGSAILLLVIVASVVDYPARTPTIMAVIVIAGVWLCTRLNAQGTDPLPERERHL